MHNEFLAAVAIVLTFAMFVPYIRLPDHLRASDLPLRLLVADHRRDNRFFTDAQRST